jgi:hypothetical protein
VSDLNELLAEMNIKLTKELLNRIESGAATPADLNVARQLLKDNNVQAAKPTANPMMLRLAEHVPFPEAEAG